MSRLQASVIIALLLVCAVATTAIAVHSILPATTYDYGTVKDLALAPTKLHDAEQRGWSVVTATYHEEAGGMLYVTALVRRPHQDGGALP